MSSAMRSRLEPFKKLGRLRRGHLYGILPWTTLIFPTARWRA